MLSRIVSILTIIILNIINITNIRCMERLVLSQLQQDAVRIGYIFLGWSLLFIIIEIKSLIKK